MDFLRAVRRHLDLPPSSLPSSCPISRALGFVFLPLGTVGGISLSYSPHIPPAALWDLWVCSALCYSSEETRVRAGQSSEDAEYAWLPGSGFDTPRERCLWASRRSCSRRRVLSLWPGAAPEREKDTSAAPAESAGGVPSGPLPRGAGRRAVQEICRVGAAVQYVQTEVAGFSCFVAVTGLTSSLVGVPGEQAPMCSSSRLSARNGSC